MNIVIHNLSDDEIIKKTLELVASSTRPMPAHYCSNGERTQSFCIDFEPLNIDDDYDMASEAIYSFGNCISNKSNLDGAHQSAVIKCGEDIMVGSYIATKLGGAHLIDKIMIKILTASPEFLLLEEVAKYLNHCVDSGKEIAER